MPLSASKQAVNTALLGIDLGSSSLKALLLDPENGSVLGARAVNYPTGAPLPGAAEQSVDDWWTACGQAVRAVLADSPAVEVVGIGLSGQMHTFVLLDREGSAVRPAITWMDTRAAPLLHDIAARLREAGAVSELANPVVLGLTLPPLIWLQLHEPESFARASVLLLAKDALRHRLTGSIGSEPTDASATLLFDVPGRRWSSAVVNAFALPANLLPSLCEPFDVAGFLTRTAARHLGLRAGVPVAFGAGDQQAAAMGTGTVRGGQAQLMVGTGAQALVVVDAPPGDSEPGLHSFCHVAGWLRQASVNNAGVALDWARRTLGLSWDGLYRSLADRAPPIAPTFLPYLTGERAPLMKGYARGGWVGLEPGHRRGDLAAAAVAGVVTAIADGLRTLPSGEGRRVRAGGGGLRYARFAQAVADAAGEPLDVLDASHASAIGAALLGGIAAGLYPDLEAAVATAAPTVARTLRPRPERAAAWTALRERLHALDAIGLHEAVAET